MIQYDPHKWLDHFLDVRGSLIREIGGRVLICSLWAAGVVWFHNEVMPAASSLTLHTLVGVPLGMLLVFRTNASYDRYWEGRRLWGAMVNDSRSLVRAASVHLAAEPVLLTELARWTSAYAWATMSTLRGKSELGPVAAELPDEVAARAAASQHVPLFVAHQMGRCLDDARRRGLISDVTQMALDGYIGRLMDSLGGCERIRKTPLPFAYVVHLRRALVLYCFTLPFALVSMAGWATVLEVTLVAYTFFGIEEIGVEIEGPFGYDENDLPLEQICATIHDNVYSLVGPGQLQREELGGAL